MTKTAKDKTNFNDIQKQVDTLKKTKNFGGLQEQLNILAKLNNQAKIKKFSTIFDILLFLQSNKKDNPKIALDCLTDAANVLLKIDSTPAKSKTIKVQKSDPKESCFKYLRTACETHGAEHPAFYSLTYRFSTQTFSVRLDHLKKACLNKNLDGLNSLMEETQCNPNLLKSKQVLERLQEIYAESRRTPNTAITCLAVILYDAALVLSPDSFSSMSLEIPDKEPIKQKLHELYLSLLGNSQLPHYLVIKAWDFFASEQQQETFIGYSKNLIEHLPRNVQANIVKNIAEFFYDKKDNDSAYNWYKHLVSLIDSTFPDYQNLFSRFNELTRLTGRLAELAEPESSVGHEDQHYHQALIAFNNAAAQESLQGKINNIRLACSSLFQACIKKHKEALAFLHKRIAELKNKKESIKLDERLTLVLLNTTRIEVLEKIGKGKSQRDVKAKPKSYYYHRTDKSNELDDLKKTTRAEIEKLLRQTTPTSFIEFAASLFLEGKVFPQDEHIARNLYARLGDQASPKAKFLYGKLCFLGRGGTKDYTTAKHNLLAITQHQEEFVAEAHFLLGQLYETKDSERSLKYYIKSAESGYKDAIYKLYFLHVLKDNIPATIALFYLFKRESTLDQSILRSMVFKRYSFSSEHIHLHLQKALLEKNVAGIPTLTAEEMQTLQQSLQGRRAEAITILGKRQAEIDQEIDHRKKVVLDLNLVEVKPETLALGIKLLQTQADPRLLLKIATISTDYPAQQALTSLKEHYQTAKDSVKVVLSMLCYEYLRANKNENDTQVTLLKNLLTVLEPNYKEQSIEALRKKLNQVEKTDGTYYDPCPSDGSDDEQELQFRKMSDQSRAHKGRSEELLKLIPTKDIEKKLEAYLKTEDSELDETTEIEAIKKIFKSCKPKTSSSHEGKVLSDLAKLNAMPLEQALGLMTTDFVIAQTRGIHFKPTTWSMEMRRSFRKQIYQDRINKKTNPHPIFSHAVYHEAKVTDFTSREEEDLHALEFSAKFIQQRLTKIQQLPQHTANDFNETEDKLLAEYFAKPCLFNSRNEQLQQLYTNNLDLFHRYLFWEIKQADSVFVNEYNHFVSTGDLPLHSLKYAYGIKPYAGHKDERLRPLWDKDAVAHRPYSGAVYLTLHPLEDYLNLPVNHVVSMNILGKIDIEEMIIHERETTFLGYLPGGRIVYTHLAKYPSFDKDYLETYQYLYGLSETLYKKLQALFRISAPHTTKRRLTKLLLGEFLCCYQHLYLIRKAEEAASENKKILIYRDIYGNFSLQPPENVAAHPNGDDHAKRKLRMLGAASTTNRNSFFTPATKRRHEDESSYTSDKDFDSEIIMDDFEVPLPSKIIDQQLTQLYRDSLAKKGVALTPVFRFPGPNDLKIVFTSILNEGKMDIESLSGEGIISYTLEHPISQILLPINFDNSHYGLAWFRFDARNQLTNVECIESLSKPDSEERWAGFLSDLKKLNAGVTIKFHHQGQQDHYSCGYYLLRNISDIAQEGNITADLQLPLSDIYSVSTELAIHRDKRSCINGMEL
jgi:TPR repeat protein